MRHTAIAILLCFLSNALFAQSDNRGSQLTGIFIDLHYTHTPSFNVRMRGFGETGNDTTFTEPHDGGGGFGIHIGWGISQWISVYGGFDLSGHDVGGARYNHGSIFYAELGTRLQLPLGDVTPYVTAAFGSRIFSMSNTSQSGNTIFIYDELSDVGASTLSFGGGLRIYFFDVSYIVSSASYPEEGIESFTTPRIRLGISLYFPLD